MLLAEIRSDIVLDNEPLQLLPARVPRIRQGRLEGGIPSNFGSPHFQVGSPDDGANVAGSAHLPGLLPPDPQQR